MAEACERVTVAACVQLRSPCTGVGRGFSILFFERKSKVDYHTWRFTWAKRVVPVLLCDLQTRTWPCIDLIDKVLKCTPLSIHNAYYDVTSHCVQAMVRGFIAAIVKIGSLCLHCKPLTVCIEGAFWLPMSITSCREPPSALLVKHASVIWWKHLGIPKNLTSFVIWSENMRISRLALWLKKKRNGRWQGIGNLGFCSSGTTTGAEKLGPCSRDLELLFASSCRWDLCESPFSVIGGWWGRCSWLWCPSQNCRNVCVLLLKDVEI